MAYCPECNDWFFTKTGEHRTFSRIVGKLQVQISVLTTRFCCSQQSMRCGSSLEDMRGGDLVFCGRSVTQKVEACCESEEQGPWSGPSLSEVAFWMDFEPQSGLNDEVPNQLLPGIEDAVQRRNRNDDKSDRAPSTRKGAYFTNAAHNVCQCSHDKSSFSRHWNARDRDSSTRNSRQAGASGKHDRPRGTPGAGYLSTTRLQRCLSPYI